MELSDEFDELEATLGTIIPMTPMASAIPSTPGPSANADYPSTPSVAMLETLFAPARRQRTTSSVEEHIQSRPSSGSFDITDQGELDELWESLDRTERQRSDSIIMFENVATEAGYGTNVTTAASSAGSLSNSPSSSVTSGGASNAGLTVSQAAQLSTGQANRADGDDKQKSSLMPPPPLPRGGPGGIRMNKAGMRPLRILPGQNKTPASKKLLTASYLSNEEGSMSFIPGRCTPEERRGKIARYVQKRSRRVWEKTIKYNVRKQFAESRPRVGGRFIPKPATQAALYASQLAQMGKLEQKLDRRVLFAVKRQNENEDGEHGAPPESLFFSSSDSESSADEEETRIRKPPLIDLTTETLIVAKKPKLVASFMKIDGSNQSNLENLL